MIKKLLAAFAIVSLAATAPLGAAEPDASDVMLDTAPAADSGDVMLDTASSEPYEAGRGLITLDGMSGMFINPTSATLPQGAWTVQYCIFSPNLDTKTLGHGFLAGIGLTDWFELGAIGNFVDPPGSDLLGAAGPYGRLRLTQRDGWVPQISLGGYGKFGDSALQTYSANLAAYQRISLDEDGFFKALGVHAGARVNWYDAGPSDAVRAYGGLELQLPLRVYVVGEITSKDSSRDAEIPYAFGLQWRAGMINMSVAAIQSGSPGQTKSLGFYYGIGGGFQF